MRQELITKMAIGLCCLMVVSMCGSTLLAQTSLYTDSFETYTNTPTSLLGQNGWLQGAWGTGTSVDVRSTTGITGSSTYAARLDYDGINGLTSAMYKQFNATAAGDGAVDVYVDMKRFCTTAQFCIGDSSMELGLDGSNLDSSGTAARFGFRNGSLVLYSDDTLYDTGVSTTPGAWYQFHATLYPSTSSYSLEVLDASGNVVVGNDDWFGGLDVDGLADVDLFTYQSSSTGGLQNLGLFSLPSAVDNVVYMDNISVTQDLTAAVPVQNLVYQDSFEAEEFGTGDGYSAGNLATQQSWQAGGWGGDATLTVKTAYSGSSDGTQAVRLGGTPEEGETSCAASIFKTISETSLADGCIDFTFDLKPFHGTGDSTGFVTLGDASMTLADDSGELDTTGIATMVGMQEDHSLVLYDGDTVIDSGSDLSSGTWYEVHVVVFPEDGTYAVEVPGLVGFDDWLDDTDERDMGDYDLFSFCDENVLGIENLGFFGSTQADGSPVYLDNISLTHCAMTTAVPEPGVVTLLLSALLLGAIPAWRKCSNR